MIGQIQAGTLNALAVASPERSSLIPKVPTIAESGVPGFSAVITYGLAAPAGTPRPIVERLNKELQAALADEGELARLRQPRRHLAPAGRVHDPLRVLHRILIAHAHRHQPGDLDQHGVIDAALADEALQPIDI